MIRPRFPEDHPYLFSAILEVIIILVFVISGLVIGVLKIQGRLSLQLAANGLLTILAIVLLSYLGWWKRIGFRTPVRWRDLWYFWLPFVPILFNLVYGLRPMSVQAAIFFLIMALLIGFVEEVFFRGLMLQPLARRGPWRAVLITTLLFSFTHAFDLLAGRPALDVMQQIGWALAIGFCFAALILYTGLIWPLVLAHAAIDFTSFITADPGGMDAVHLSMTILVILAFTAYSLWLMAKIQKKNT
jgi:uncharacterized protein